MNYLKVYDFKSPNDCFLVEIRPTNGFKTENEPENGLNFSLSGFPTAYPSSRPEMAKLRPCSPNPPYTSTHNERDFDKFVPLPFYSRDSFEAQRWQRVQRALQQISLRQAPTIKELINTLWTYSEGVSFKALQLFLGETLKKDKVDYFLLNLIPKMAKLALSIEKLITQPIPLLKTGRNCSVTLSQEQVASLLANAFFCTFPENLRRDSTTKSCSLNSINFDGIFSMRYYKSIEKLKCLFVYFRDVTLNMPPGNITIMRTTLDENWQTDFWSTHFYEFEALNEGTIEDSGEQMLQMDFANKFIGGGVLGQGCVQEEIRFLICPEAIVSCLMCEKMSENDAIRIIGAQRFSNYRGYGDTFQFATLIANKNEIIERDEFGRIHCEILAIDAIYNAKRSLQFKPEAIKRELNKAFAGFSITTPQTIPQPNSTIATGNWGCGAFRGDRQLKSLLQWMAASMVQRKLCYFTFGDAQWARELNGMVSLIRQKDLSIGRDDDDDGDRGQRRPFKVGGDRGGRGGLDSFPRPSNGTFGGIILNEDLDPIPPRGAFGRGVDSRGGRSDRNQSTNNYSRPIPRAESPTSGFNDEDDDEEGAVFKTRSSRAAGYDPRNAPRGPIDPTLNNAFSRMDLRGGRADGYSNSSNRENFNSSRGAPQNNRSEFESNRRVESNNNNYFEDGNPAFGAQQPPPRQSNNNDRFAARCGSIFENDAGGYQNSTNRVTDRLNSAAGVGNFGAGRDDGNFGGARTGYPHETPTGGNRSAVGGGGFGGARDSGSRFPNNDSGNSGGGGRFGNENGNSGGGGRFGNENGPSVGGRGRFGNENGPSVGGRGRFGNDSGNSGGGGRFGNENGNSGGGGRRFGNENGNSGGGGRFGNAGDNSSGNGRFGTNNRFNSGQAEDFGGGRFGGRSNGNRDSYDTNRSGYGDRSTRGGGYGAGSFESRAGGGYGVGYNRPDRNNDPDRERVDPYVPKSRTAEEIFAEDEKAEQKGNYSDLRTEDDDIVVTGLPEDQATTVMERWDEVPLHEKLMKNIERAKYMAPRKIQSYAIPLILDGYDIKGHAETGSGKTAAFLIPIIDKILKKKEADGDEKWTSKRSSPFAIVVEPTRELALQVYEQAVKFAHETGISVAKAYGAYHLPGNMREIGMGCDILIACPGRLQHIAELRYLLFENLKFLVFDECDLILQDNFMVNLRDIANCEKFPPKEERQTLLFSATFPEVVQNWACDWLKDNNLMVSNKKNTANAKVIQNFEVVTEYDKNDRVVKILKDELMAAKENAPEEERDKIVPRRTLVFVKTKKLADILANYLCMQDIKAATVNGDRPQQLREKVMKEFRDNEVNVIVATDVCSRGIDIKDLDHVINRDLPDEYDKYVHRVGRTGRLVTGVATSFFDPHEANDQQLAKDLVRGLKESSQEVPTFLIEVAENRYVSELHKQEEDAWGANEAPEVVVEGKDGEDDEQPDVNGLHVKAAVPIANNDDW